MVHIVSRKEERKGGNRRYQRLEANWTSVERVLRRDITVARGGGTS